LTPAGELLIGEFETIIDSYNRIQENIRTLQNRSGQKLRIGYGYDFSCEEERYIMSLFIRKNPGVILTRKILPSSALKKQLIIGALDGVFVSYISPNAEAKMDLEYPEEQYSRQLISQGNWLYLLAAKNNPLTRHLSLSRENREEILQQKLLLPVTSDGEALGNPKELMDYLEVTQNKVNIQMLDRSTIPLLSSLLQDGQVIFPCMRQIHTVKSDPVSIPQAEMTAIPASDWPYTVYLYFISSRFKDDPALHRFKACAQEYAELLQN
jgi:DNA-binding transcriptional LysR family regulator